MTQTTERDLAGVGIRVIDLEFMGTPEVIAAYLLDAGTSSLLVETGPTTSLASLEAGLAGAGKSFADISHILVTHIHLDHSGAAGAILRDYPHIEVLVHPVGSPHLIAPERLVRSAGRIYGDDMERLWGEVVGVPADRVTALEDDSRLRIGERRLRVAYTAGHASHHVVILDEESGTLFSGDVGGVRVPGTRYVAAPIPPPEVDPSAWVTSLERMRALGGRRIAPTHFGVYEDVEAHLGQIPGRLQDLVALGERVGGDLDDTAAMTDLVAAYQREALGVEATPSVLARLALANPDVLGAMGLQRYLRKRV